VHHCPDSLTCDSISVDQPLAVTNSTNSNNDTCFSTNLATGSYPLMLLLNATSVRKPNALQHLAITETNSDFGSIVETCSLTLRNVAVFASLFLGSMNLNT